MPRASDIARRLTSEGRTPEEIRDAAYLSTGDVAAKQTRFWLLLTLSAAIATAGIVADSTATVIGAMVIAPLATPIQGIAVGIAYGDLRPLLQSATTLLTSMAVVVLLAAGLSEVLPQLKDGADNTQIAGRVSPTIVDLVAAAATGLAGSFAIARRDVGDILPGVAIAISLVPPLAVVGVTGATGDYDDALGALLLFLTNVLAIVMAGMLVFGAVHLRQGHRRDPRFRTRPVLAVVAAGAVVVVGALAVATFRTVQLSDHLDAATDVGSEWAADHGERVVTTRFDGTTFVLVVEGMSDGTQDEALPALLQGAVPDGTKVVVNRIAGSRRELGAVR
jgi:uncharacterized hydrophobic protein (TIGR00271 family)